MGWGWGVAGVDKGGAAAVWEQRSSIAAGIMGFCCSDSEPREQFHSKMFDIV